MERSDLNTEIAAAEQELSALLEKHINAPVKQRIEEVSGGLALTLKDDFGSSILSLRSELKKLNSAIEELGEDLSDVRQASRRIEKRVQQAESAQESRFEKAGAQSLENHHMVTERIAGAEERFSKLGAAQLGVLSTLAADIQINRTEIRDEQKKMLDTLDSIVSAISAQDAQTVAMQRLSRQRFIGLIAAFSLSIGGLLALLIKGVL